MDQKVKIPLNTPKIGNVFVLQIRVGKSIENSVDTDQIASDKAVSNLG